MPEAQRTEGKPGRYGYWLTKAGRWPHETGAAGSHPGGGETRPEAKADGDKGHWNGIVVSGIFTGQKRETIILSYVRVVGWKRLNELQGGAGNAESGTR